MVLLADDGAETMHPAYNCDLSHVATVNALGEERLESHVKHMCAAQREHWQGPVDLMTRARISTVRMNSTPDTLQKLKPAFTRGHSTVLSSFWIISEENQ